MHHPYQSRVLVERHELNIKIEDLSTFIESNPLFWNCVQDERDDLMVQLDIMEEYSDILDSRINRFTQ